MPADLGRELALPFEQIIGGPLQGVIKGSVMSSSATAEFIKKVGLTQENGKDVPVMVDFTIDRWRQAEPGAKATPEKLEIRVPLLTMVPVPFLRLTKTTLDFEVKIQSTTVEKEDKSLNAEASVSASFWGVSASFKGSYESKSAREDTTNRSATLGVHVEAVQDDMPKGGAREQPDRAAVPRSGRCVACRRRATGAVHDRRPSHAAGVGPGYEWGTRPGPR